MIPNPFPRVLLISFFLSTLSLAFNPGSKRGHLNRRGEEQSATPPQPVRPSSSSPFIPSPPPSTDVSSRPDLSTGFRRSSSLPINFSPLSSYKSALDTADWSAGSPAPSSHGSDGAFGPSSYPSVSTTPSDRPRTRSGKPKLADFLSTNVRDEQSLPADVPEAEIKETSPTARNLAKKKVWYNLEKNEIHEIMNEEDAPIPANPSRLAKVKESISSRFAPFKAKMRNHLVDLKDHIAIATNPELANYRTIGGIPVFLESGTPESSRVVLAKAQAAAGKIGKARVFHNLDQYKKQSLVVYTGKSSDGSTAPRHTFKTYPVPEDKALPLPKAWTRENLVNAILQSETGSPNRFYDHVPERWPTKVRKEVKQWPTKVRTEVKQWPTKVKQWPTKVRTEVNRLTAMVRPVGPNQQRMDQQPVAGKWNRLGDRIGNAWGRMKIAGSNIGENVRGLFKGGNPSAAVSSAREIARPIRR